MKPADRVAGLVRVQTNTGATKALQPLKSHDSSYEEVNVGQTLTQFLSCLESEGRVRLNLVAGV
jgi:hypothetical protein